MTLREQQSLFIRQLALLLTYAGTIPGYELTGGELERTKAQAAANAASGAGISNSLHLQCLAIDLKLFIDGVYQTKSEAYAQLGAYWKQLHPLNRWGGDFHDRPDGNHFSSTRDGVK